MSFALDVRECEECMKKKLIRKDHEPAVRRCATGAEECAYIDTGSTKKFKPAGLIDASSSRSKMDQ